MQSVAKTVDKATEAAPKRERIVHQELFKSGEEAVKAAENRVRGPRRAFKCTANGQTWFVVHNNEGRAAGRAFMELGGTVEELGQKKRTAKPLGAEGILQAIASLPEADRAKVLEQMKALQKK